MAHEREAILIAGLLSLAIVAMFVIPEHKMPPTPKPQVQRAKKVIRAGMPVCSKWRHLGHVVSIQKGSSGEIRAILVRSKGLVLKGVRRVPSGQYYRAWCGVRLRMTYFEFVRMPRAM